MENLETPEWSFRWVQERWRNNDYGAVQEISTLPTNRAPLRRRSPRARSNSTLPGSAPSTRPALSCDGALCRVTWAGGSACDVFVHATKPVGWFRFRSAPGRACAPRSSSPLRLRRRRPGPIRSTGQDLSTPRLRPARVTESHGGSLIVYRQPGWGGFYYEIAVAWRTSDGRGVIEGAWSISSKFSDERREPTAEAVAGESSARGSHADASPRTRHGGEAFWAKSAIELPDPILEKQWYLEQYKFGSAARRGAPPISLQAVWTADNGRLPPWKGDFHHDLNTQLSYWPCYSGNHLEEGLGFLDWLWDHPRRSSSATPETYFGDERAERARAWPRSPASRWAAGSSTRFSPDRLRLAGPAFRPSLALQPGPEIPRGAGLSLDQGRRRLPGRDISPGPGRPAAPAPEFEPRDLRQPRSRPGSPTTTNFDLALISWTLQDGGRAWPASSACKGDARALAADPGRVAGLRRRPRGRSCMFAPGS